MMKYTPRVRSDTAPMRAADRPATTSAPPQASQADEKPASTSATTV